jgi:hypothetical protein
MSVSVINDKKGGEKMNKVFEARHIVIGVVLFVLAVCLIVSRVAVAAGEVLSEPSDKTLYEGQNIPITDLQVNGTGNDVLSMKLSASNGSLQFLNSDGLTFDGPTYGSIVQFSGTRTDINSALATLRYYADTPGSHTVEVTLGDGNYWVENGHVYLVVEDAGISWQDAKVAAENMQYGGVNGYLATITSQEEHDFILERIGSSGWIGANDVASEGVWRWQTGPEAGQQFWSGDFESGSAVGGAFTNWNDGEPNNSGDSEDCGQIWFSESSEGQWNDLQCDSAQNQYYVAEFGELGALPTVTNTDFQVTVNAAPAIDFTTLSPGDNSQVSRVSSLQITFNQPMEVGEGYLRVYDAADDSEIAELWDADTEDGRTFTFALPETLQPGKNYYVTLSDSFMIGLVDYYDGFSDKTTWNFAVVDGDGISAAIEDAAPNEGDGNGDGILDSNQANVASFIDPVTNSYAVLAVDDECSITSAAVVAESSETEDGIYNYPAGLMDFRLDCGTQGFTATIEQYYYGVSNGAYAVRKFNPTLGNYTTINTAVVSQSIIDGVQATKATYQVTDGGEYDLDGTVNGEIVDPAGLAQLMVGAPNTGFERHGVNVLGIAGMLLCVSVAAGLYAVRRALR